MSDTPITDAALDRQEIAYLANVSRDLEQQLAAAQAELSMLEESENGLLKTIAVLEAELGRYRYNCILGCAKCGDYTAEDRISAQEMNSSRNRERRQEREQGDGDE